MYRHTNDKIPTPHLSPRQNGRWNLSSSQTLRAETNSSTWNASIKSLPLPYATPVRCRQNNSNSSRTHERRGDNPTSPQWNAPRGPSPPVRLPYLRARHPWTHHGPLGHHQQLPLQTPRGTSSPMDPYTWWSYAAASPRDWNLSSDQVTRWPHTRGWI